MQDLSQCTHSYYTRGSAEFLVLPPTSPRFTVLCRKGLNRNSFHPSHFMPSLLSGFLLNHWVVDSEWLLKDYPRQGKAPPGHSVTVENELLIPAALTKQSEVRPKLLTNSINSKVAKVAFNLIFLHSLGEDPEIVNHVFFPHQILSHHHGETWVWH